jgi:hypothetical protein
MEFRNIRQNRSRRRQSPELNPVRVGYLALASLRCLDSSSSSVPLANISAKQGPSTSGGTAAFTVCRPY